jgi:hypothetical protein
LNGYTNHQNTYKQQDKEEQAMGLFGRIFTATPEELAEMQRDTKGFLEKTTRELELELLRRKQQQELIINTLNGKEPKR